jgi:hypothetical protein
MAAEVSRDERQHVGEKRLDPLLLPSFLLFVVVIISTITDRRRQTNARRHFFFTSTDSRDTSRVRVRSLVDVTTLFFDSETCVLFRFVVTDWRARRRSRKITFGILHVTFDDTSAARWSCWSWSSYYSAGFVGRKIAGEDDGRSRRHGTFPSVERSEKNAVQVGLCEQNREKK